MIPGCDGIPPNPSFKKLTFVVHFKIIVNFDPPNILTFQGQKIQSMNILFILIGVSLFAALIFLAMFIWAVKTGQYDDNYTPSIRILFDEDEEEMRN
jgi:cbb3-type cytochrome oxidase maturation protein